MQLLSSPDASHLDGFTTLLRSQEEDVLLCKRVWNDLLQGSEWRAAPTGVEEGRSCVVPAGQPPKM